MPKFLEDKLKREYGDNSHAVYGTMNKIGAMHGNKETGKGREMQAKHDADKKKPSPEEKAKHDRSLHSRDANYYRANGILPAVPLKAVPVKRPFQYKAVGEK